jgi:predicted NBD/HSP70 family sugar kinase
VTRASRFLTRLVEPLGISLAGVAMSGLLAAVVALSDPELIVIGGSWGAPPLILDAITTAFTRLPRLVAVRAAKLGAESSLAGARTDALDRLRLAIVAAAH